MPKHIASGLKYLAAVELIREGYSQKEISEKLDMDRSTLSHYLNGRNISMGSIEIAELIKGFCPKDFLELTSALLENRDTTITIVKTCLNQKYRAKVRDSCKFSQNQEATSLQLTPGALFYQIHLDLK